MTSKYEIELKTIAGAVQSWIDWSTEQHEHESLEIEDGTHIMALPVPYWPSHGMLKNWVEVLNKAALEPIA